MGTALRIGAIGAWVAWLVVMAACGETTPALIGAALGTFGLGAFVNRWWVLLTVLIPGFTLALWSAAAGTDSDSSHGSGLDWALWFFVPATILVAALMALGVLCRRIAARSRHTRPGRGPMPAR